MDNDILIDYNHLYNIILSELLTVFPKSKTSFKFDTIYSDAGLDKLEYDDSYYWFKSMIINHADFIRHFLLREGIIEESIINGHDSQLSAKGLAIVEAGGFKKYQTFRERQENLEQEIKESTVATNKSVISTNNIQKITLLITVVVSLCSLWLTYNSQNHLNEQLKIENQSLQLQQASFQKEKAEKVFQLQIDSLKKVLLQQKIQLHNKLLQSK